MNVHGVVYVMEKKASWIWSIEESRAGGPPKPGGDTRGQRYITNRQESRQ